jgi:hypothetical protein
LTSQTDRVEKIKSNGNPAEKPNKLICKDCLVRRGLILKIFINVIMKLYNKILL